MRGRIGDGLRVSRDGGRAMYVDPLFVHGYGEFEYEQLRGRGA
jgi:hypothetical protein